MVNEKRIYILKFLILTVGIVIQLLYTGSLDTSSAATEFGESVKDNSKQISFYWIAGVIAGCIVITLSYVSYRKYKGEKKKQLEKEKNQDKSVD
ncbi:sporulation protein YpjB [Virgibacillus natechei]|uniref:sporulation protein YpjB n=1 Tax=Virgibacillus natechei TaxID=1216297 RepID=UPI001AE28491|nr:sporulation protein YpjB [Virgibacillus natechei]UZD11327.1 sporulation protein YpjB [Virgibacillus natechei]